ncbi:MAG TPA: hypothetical protein VFN02_13655, partial [Ktedonobacteraceae bacterium]|nr:hypothetical protein [Ktedonobacteraceae bacterium]
QAGVLLSQGILTATRRNTWNTTLMFVRISVETPAKRLLRLASCTRLWEPRTVLAISTTETHMTTCLTLLGRCVTEACSLQKLDEKAKNAKGKRWPRLKQHNA